MYENEKLLKSYLCGMVDRPQVQSAISIYLLHKKKRNLGFISLLRCAADRPLELKNAQRCYRCCSAVISKQFYTEATEHLKKIQNLGNILKSAFDFFFHIFQRPNKALSFPPRYFHPICVHISTVLLLLLVEIYVFRKYGLAVKT